MGTRASPAAMPNHDATYEMIWDNPLPNAGRTFANELLIDSRARRSIIREGGRPSGAAFAVGSFVTGSFVAGSMKISGGAVTVFVGGGVCSDGCLDLVRKRS